LEKRYAEKREAVNKRPFTNLPTKPLHFTYEPQGGELDMNEIEFR
jgi:hypothetical protein